MRSSLAASGYHLSERNSPPFTLEHLPNLEEALSCFQYHYTLVLGYINADIGHSQKPRSQQVADMLMYFGPLDLLRHFHQRLRFLQLNTCSQVRQSRLLRARCHYILGSDRQLFEIVGVRDIMNYSLDHFAL